MTRNPEKIPDAPLSDIAYAGVAVGSRWGKRRELEEMMSAIDWCLDRDPETARLIVEFWCDSQGCAFYTVNCCHSDRPCILAEVEAVAELVAEALRVVAGGYNGIYVNQGDRHLSVDVGCWWPEGEVE